MHKCAVFHVAAVPAVRKDFGAFAKYSLQVFELSGEQDDIVSIVEQPELRGGPQVILDSAQTQLRDQFFLGHGRIGRPGLHANRN